MTFTLSFYVTMLRKDFTAFCNERLQEMGLSQGLLFFILYIGKHPACSPGELSGALQFDTGHTTRSIDKLVQTGFVSREKNEQDRRAYVLRLTDQGIKAFEASHDLFLEWDEQILKELSAVERTQLLTLIQKLEPCHMPEGVRSPSAGE